jgi:superoxide reductase
MAVKDLLQSADWKQEKHVPVLDAPELIKKGESVKVVVTVGKEIAHPNTTEHHIAWVQVYFLPQDEKFPYQVGNFEFVSHGASTQGPNTSSVYTQPEITVNVKIEKSGTLLATSYCNIHGVWESSKELKVE